MASIPTRAADLAAVLDTVVPQVDRLHLFLHGYDTVPSAARRPGVIAYPVPRQHPYRASGKFFGLSHEAGPCLYFGFDDDILYGPGYVDRLRDALLRYGGLAIVGLHAIDHANRAGGYLASAEVRHFTMGLSHDRIVDQLGCGTAAFYSAVLPLDPPSWPSGQMDDLLVAIEAERRGIPRITVRRPSGSTTPLAENQDDSLYRLLRRDEGAHGEALETLRRLRRSRLRDGA